MKRAWYLGHTSEEVGEGAILIGDPDRINKLALLLENPVYLPVSRGLKTITGTYRGWKITAVSFGMGAPIATIVLHELATLGIKNFLRIGTAMYYPPAQGGHFLISESALGYDGTSRSYLDLKSPYQAEDGLVRALLEAVISKGETGIKGLYATYDAFYRDMFGIDEEGCQRAAKNRQVLAQKKVLAVDMETAALLAASKALQVSCATLCIGTVDAQTLQKLPAKALATVETRLFELALEGLVQFISTKPKNGNKP